MFPSNFLDMTSVLVPRTFSKWPYEAERTCYNEKWYTTFLKANFGECSIINLLFSFLRNIYLLISPLFLCFSLVTMNWHIPNDPGILREDYGIIKSFIGQSAIVAPVNTPVSFVKTTESYEDCRCFLQGLPIGSPS